MEVSKQITGVALVLVCALVLGCSAHMHTVGKGAQGGEQAKARQWYVLFGLVPINTVDTKAMAGSATDYTIKTEQSFLDIVINFFTGIVTVNSRTVTVKK